MQQQDNEGVPVPFESVQGKEVPIGINKVQTPEYITEYEKFVNEYKFTEVSSEEVGLLISRMAMYFARYNSSLKNALRDYSIIIRDIQIQTDPSTGKAMSSAKAETLAAASQQAADYESLKIDVSNIQEYINALKSLQKGVLQEYANVKS